MISLAEKRILVMGATGTIGRTILEEAKGYGAWVAGSYWRSADKARELQSQGVWMVQADLTDRSQARACVQQVLAEAGHLDGLVYAAGNAADHTLTKLSEADWDQVFKLHLGGLVACAQEVLPSMRRRGRGKIIALGSMAGQTGRIGQANYSAAKGATVGFIKTLAREAGRFGVSANVICPGFVESEMTRSAPPAAWDQARADSVLGTLSSAQVVASFSGWLLSDLCQGVTGQVFHLDSRIL